MKTLPRIASMHPKITATITRQNGIVTRRRGMTLVDHNDSYSVTHLAPAKKCHAGSVFITLIAAILKRKLLLMGYKIKQIMYLIIQQ
jgi:hypothetical protein